MSSSVLWKVQEELPAPPEVEQDTQGYQLPSDVIARLRETVFGFDTFFVTKTENYQADGVLFKGNLRGDPKESYARMQRRCQVPPSLLLIAFSTPLRAANPLATRLCALAWNIRCDRIGHFSGPVASPTMAMVCRIS